MAEKSKDIELREIIAKLRYIEGQIASAQAQLQMFERGMLEIGNTKLALNSLKTLSKDTGSLLPIGSGMFAKGTLSKQDKILVDAGAGAIVEKDVADAEKVLDSRESEIRTSMLNIQQTLAVLEKEYNVLGEKARSLTG